VSWVETDNNGIFLVNFPSTAFNVAVKGYVFSSSVFENQTN